MQHRRPPWFAELPIIVAHRGASDEFIENTWPAFERAVELGVPIELDVRSSADGVLIVCHDDSLVRLTGRDGFVISRQRADEIESVELTRAGTGEPFRLIRLETLLQKLPPDWPIFVEVKCDSKGAASGMAEALVKILRGYGPRRFLVISFNPYVLQALSEIEPMLLRGYLISDYHESTLPWWQKLLLRSQMLYFVGRWDGVLLERTLLRNFVELMWGRFFAPAFHAVWTADSVDEWEASRRMGIDAIITNRPQAALAWRSGLVDKQISS